MRKVRGQIARLQAKAREKSQGIGVKNGALGEALRSLDSIQRSVSKLIVTLPAKSAKEITGQFARLRAQIVNVKKGNWQESYEFCRDLTDSQAELAEMLGVSEKTVRNYERSKGMPARKTGPKAPTK